MCSKSAGLAWLGARKQSSRVPRLLCPFSVKAAVPGAAALIAGMGE